MTLTDLIEVAVADSSQTAFAAKVGVGQTTVSGWQRGISLPPSTRIDALAAALGMPAQKLKAVVSRERKARAIRAHAAKVSSKGAA